MAQGKVLVSDYEGFIVRAQTDAVVFIDSGMLKESEVKKTA